MIECTSPEGHLFNKWAIEGGAVCSICGVKLSLGETLAMLCELPALKRENMRLLLLETEIKKMVEHDPNFKGTLPSWKPIMALLAPERQGDKHKPITLTEDEFDDLSEYSASIPTGVIIGKCWKAHLRTGKWVHREYAEDPDSDEAVLILTRDIVIVGKDQDDE